MIESIHYPLGYQRRETRVVTIGAVKMGGTHPIVIQSMLTSPTADIERCMAEIRELDQVNCEMIRLSLTSAKDLDAIPALRNKMASEGIVRPLVADVHFSPQLAIDACEVFEKVRINPGNFVDQPKNGKQQGRMSLSEGRALLKEAIQPLVKNLKTYQRTLRIGVNQGSLSSRMIEQYGDSPQGMVASAVEFVELLEAEGIDQIVISLKSSNPAVVLQAYRLLVETLPKTNGIPLHLGVTEAGNGTIGRIKSLAGIGPLLLDGIGDTIRVSLTEACCNEIDYANRLTAALKRDAPMQGKIETVQRALGDTRNRTSPFQVNELTLGGATPVKVGTVEGDLLPPSKMDFEADFRYHLDGGKGTARINGKACSVAVIDSLEAAKIDTPQKDDVCLISSRTPLWISRVINGRNPSKSPVGIVIPVLTDGAEEIRFFTEISSVLSEGGIDFILLPSQMSEGYFEKILSLLQATRTRLVAPDYIACPSCGRTLFDLKKTTEKIKERTSHLKGVKIGIMGCIVNGPGEMADADFGYVGSGKGRVDLYFGREKVKRGIAESDAVEALIELIKSRRMWVEPKK